MCIGLNVNVHYYLPILMKLEFSWQFFEKSSNPNFMKILPFGAELILEERRTDITELIFGFPNFAEAPEN
jgi:hypothetical protein